MLFFQKELMFLWGEVDSYKILHNLLKFTLTGVIIHHGILFHLIFLYPFICPFVNHIVASF